MKYSKNNPAGVGGYVAVPNGTWFQVSWADTFFLKENNRDIHFRELLAVVALVLVNQDLFANKHIGL